MAAKKGDTDSAKVLAKEVVNSRKAVSKIYTAKANLGSIEMQMKQQVKIVNPQCTIFLCQPSEYWTSLVFEWSKSVWLLDGKEHTQLTCINKLCLNKGGREVKHIVPLPPPRKSQKFCPPPPGKIPVDALETVLVVAGRAASCGWKFAEVE